MSTPTLQLSREVRFGLDSAALPPGSQNGFAAQPPVAGVGPFLTLTVTVTGTIDPATGMVMNIKHIDQVVREVAVAEARAAKDPATLLRRLRALLVPRFAPQTLARLTLAVSPYVCYAIDSKEPTMVELTERFEFSAAHRLHAPALSEQENQQVFGRCTNANGHGHNYQLEVTIAGEPDAGTGQLLPLAELQRIVNTHVIDVLDHKHLNLDCPEFARLNPTVENIAQVIFAKLAPALAPVKLRCVRVWETPKTYCSVCSESSL